MRSFIMAVVATLGCTSTPTGATQPDEWAAPAPAWEGTWQGTIGTLGIHVCLDTTPYQAKGAYYYDRSKKLLRLEPGKAEGEWFEQEVYGKNGARWQITADTDSVTGTWTSGAKSMPVSLKRVGGPSGEYAGPCGSMDFLGPRLEPVTVTSEPGMKDGSRYTVWTFKPGVGFEDGVEISTFTLDQPGAAVARVNLLLKAALPKSVAKEEWIECIAGNVNHSGMDGTFSKIVEPRLVTGRWLAADEHGEYYCGGAHPTNANIPRTFDLVEGVEVDPLDWFLRAAVHSQDLGGDYGEYKTLTPALVALILNNSPARNDDECMEATRIQESWKVGVERGALVFSPDFPRVIMACGDDYKVPFHRLQPWLNKKGKAAVATLPR